MWAGKNDCYHDVPPSLGSCFRQELLGELINNFGHI